MMNVNVGDESVVVKSEIREWMVVGGEEKKVLIVKLFVKFWYLIRVNDFYFGEIWKFFVERK